MEHPLSQEWTFYYYWPDRSLTYEECLRKIGSTKTVETFWKIYSHIKPPDQLDPHVSVSFFNNESRPIWEDDEYRNGGCFYIHSPANDLKFMWERVVLACVGGRLPEDVAGVTYSLQKELIYVWNRQVLQARNTHDALISALRFPPNVRLQYKEWAI